MYLAQFQDSLIPPDVPLPAAQDPELPTFLYGWEAWGKIVVKVVAGADSDSLARLQAESAILQELRPASFPHLHYCNLFTENPVSEERLSERLYVSIEQFIESTPLSQLENSYVGNEKEVVAIALEVACALLPLWGHHRKFVHRDIKPANLLMKVTGGVAVIDLGIVRETGAPGVTHTGWMQAPFTPGYGAPEQIANDKDAVSYKTDFFSIGVLMYRLMSGQGPFYSRANMGLHEVISATTALTPPPLKTIAGASQKLSDFVEKAMMKEPWRRQRTPAQFIDELRNI